MWGMHEAPVLPDDLESCQRLLQAAWAMQAELTRTCTTLHQSQEHLRRENEELQWTIKLLLRQRYGRRSERLVEGRGQQQLDFGDRDTACDLSIVSAAPGEALTEEFVVRRRVRVRRRSEGLPDHLERRTQRIEPPLPEGIDREACAMIGVDVVEILEYERGKLWVRRLEYPKYKLPSCVSSAVVEVEPVVATDSTESVEIGVVMEPDQDNQTGNESAQLPTETSDIATRPAAGPRSVAQDMVETRCIIQASREISLIEGGRFGFGVAAEVLFSKYGLHVPLYRQQDRLAQLGWSPSRSTLGLIVATSAELLGPLADRCRQRVLASENIGTDDTPVTLLTPGEGEGSRQARFWLYRGRVAAPYDVFAFTDSRSRDGPDKFLERFRGILSGDCYSGYVNIEQVTQGRIKFSACLSHARRYVFDAREQHPVLGSKMLALIRQLYDIEDRARTLEDAHRLEMRQRESVPVMQRLRELLDSAEVSRVLPRSKFGEAVNYLRNHWSAFQVYLVDGRVPIDNNDVERDLRRIAVGRNNWLFIGSEQAGNRTATILTIMASAHRHDLDVWAYVRDVLEQLARARAAAGGDVSQIHRELLDSLLPEVWAQTHAESIRTFRTQEKEQRAAIRCFKRANRRTGSQA